jgi:hypothetical protein
VSVNLGNDAIAAIKELRGNNHFETLIAALGVFSQNMYISAMDSDVTTRVDKSAYARGMYHVWQAMHAAYADVHMSQAKLPAPGKKVATNV